MQVTEIIGGQGQNRTADTRIFSPHTAWPGNVGGLRPAGVFGSHRIRRGTARKSLIGRIARRVCDWNSEPEHCRVKAIDDGGNAGPNGEVSNVTSTQRVVRWATN